MQLPFMDRRPAREVSIDEVLNRRTDLSTFVVHLTRDSDESSAAEKLASIIAAKHLLAGEPRGWATAERLGVSREALSTQRVVCFSETPLEQVHSLFADIAGRSMKFRGYGVAFPKMVARWMGVNPVWYVDMSPSPDGQWRDWFLSGALNEMVRGARDQFNVHPISKIAPFIEGMGTWPNGNGSKQREFSWEREWRHLGDLDLTAWWSKALWFAPEAELYEFRNALGPDTHCVDPAWSLERIIGHLLGMKSFEMTPFAVR